MRVLLRLHNDLDGIAAAFILKKALEQKHNNAQIFFDARKTVKPQEIKKLSRKAGKYDRIYFIDTGAERGPEINKYWSRELREKTVIIDHHRLFDRERPQVAEYINPEEDGKDSLYWATASTLVYKYVQEELGVHDYRLALPAVMGAYSDLADFFGGLHGLNAEVAREAVEAGVLNENFGFTARFKDRDTIADVIDENYYPIPRPGFRAVLPKKYHNMKYYSMSMYQIEKMAEELETVYDGMHGWAFRDTLYLKNGNKHYGEIHDAVSTVEELIGYYGEHETFRGVKAGMKALEVLMKNRTPAFIPPARNRFMGSRASTNGTRHIETPKYHLLIGYRRFIKAAEATFIATRIFTDKPVIVVGFEKGRAYVTARMHPSLYKKYDLGAEMYNVLQKRLKGYGGGHRIAAGGGIDSRKVDDLVRIFAS